MGECGLTNLAICLPEKFFEFLLSILNSVLEPLLNLVRNLLTEQVNINIFYGLWVVIVYLISIFYGLFFLFAGFNFMISGYNAQKRENAKAWIRNIVLMMLFIQSSFFIYNVILEMGSLLTTAMINIINPEFFLLRANNLSGFGLQLVFTIPYVITLVITALLLALRYLFVSIGVVLFPIAIFFYFIPPLQSYGKLLLNILIGAILITFFDAIILFGASILLDASIFGDYGIIVTTTGFMSVNLAMILLMVFGILKSAFSIINTDLINNVAKSVKYLV